jgi:molybdate transport system regulatory protein
MENDQYEEYSFEKKEKDPLDFQLILKIKRKHQETDAFGIGIADLMQGVDALGSLLKAAQRMSMAYSKAWKVIQRVEAQLGFPLIFRQAGRGYGSILTPEGRRFLEHYKLFLKEVHQMASESFKQHFSDF